MLRISEPTHIDRENLVLQTAAISRGTEAAATYTKLPTGKLAAKLGLQSARLYDKLIGSGYLEVCEGKKRLTAKGKDVGGEYRFNKGPYFLWPTDLKV